MERAPSSWWWAAASLFVPALVTTAWWSPTCGATEAERAGTEWAGPRPPDGDGVRVTGSGTALEVEPAAGSPLTPRRDPLDLPLREEERWQEWLLAVRLNGLEVGTGTLVIRDPVSGRLAVPVEELRRWRLRVDRDRILSFQGMPYYPLDALEGARFEVDESTLVLSLYVPPERFEPTLLGPGPRGETPEPLRAAGAFLDYDLLYEMGERAHEELHGLAEVGLFGGPGVLLSSFRVRDALGDIKPDRLETTFVRDFPDKRTSLRIGDTLTVGGSFARSVHFGGIQYGINFATDPDFVAFPLPAIGGLAEQPSTVELLVDGVRQMVGEVPPGPFSINQLPVVTGAGEVQLKVTDLLGRERLITQSYYVSPRLLREGVHDFSYEAGVIRERFGEASFDYDQGFVAATHRYGFTDSLTGEVHAEVEPDRVAAIAGGGLRLGLWGVLTGGVGGSAGDAGTGAFLQGAYEYAGRGFDLGLRSRYTSRDLELFGESGTVERTDSASLGVRLGDTARLGLILSHQVRRTEEDILSTNASLSARVGAGSLIINAAALLEPRTDAALILSYTLPLSGYRSATVQLDVREHRTRARAQFRQGRGATDLGLDYRIAGEIGDDPRYLDARLSWQGRHGGAELEAEADADGSDLRVGVTGTAALVGGRPLLTRRIGRAFGLIRVPGHPGVRVYLDNREVGRTDARGEILVPGLQPYAVNRIRLAVEDLPLGAVPERQELEIVPGDRAAVIAEFRIFSDRRATARLLDEAGTPLPPGSELTGPQGLSAIVARDGFTQITGLGTAAAEIRGTDTTGIARVCRLPAAPADDPLPHLGEIRCGRS